MSTVETRSDIHAEIEAYLANNFGALGFHQINGKVPAEQLNGGEWPGTLGPGTVGEAELEEPNTWLRLATVADRKINFGVATITGTGTSQASDSVTHGLGTTPLVVLATADRTAGSATQGGLLATASGLGATTFTLGIRDVGNPPENFSDDHDVYWVAIG